MLKENFCNVRKMHAVLFYYTERDNPEGGLVFLLSITSGVITELFDMYADMVYRISLNILKNPEEAQDVVMDVFTTLLHTVSFNDTQHVKAWLIKTAEHRSLNALKSARMRRNIPFDEQLENTLTSSLNESEYEVLDSVMRLPEKLRTTIYMYYYEDMDADEIAKILGISKNTVYKRLERARGLLKSGLEGAAI